MSTSGVASSAWRKARTMSSVFLSVCPALSARCDDIWIAGPSAIGSVNGMPSSTTSAPAAGMARSSASEVSGSGSPAVRNVTSAARPCDLSSSKRRSIRVVMGRTISPDGQSGNPLRLRSRIAAMRTLMVPSINITIEPMNCTHSLFSRMGPGVNSRTRRKYAIYATDATIKIQPTIFCLLITGRSRPRSSLSPFQISRHARQILVAASGQVDHHEMILRLLRRQIHHPCQRMRGFERGDDAFEPRAQLERGQRLLVRRRKVLHPLDVVEPGVLRADAGVIEAGGDRVRLVDLSVLVHEQVGAVAVQHPGPAAGDRGRVQAAREPVPRRFHAVT